MAGEGVQQERGGSSAGGLASVERGVSGAAADKPRRAQASVVLDERGAIALEAPESHRKATCLNKRDFISATRMPLYIWRYQSPSGNIHIVLFCDPVERDFDDCVLPE